MQRLLARPRQEIRDALDKGPLQAPEMITARP
jgi:hypothetical protein